METTPTRTYENIKTRCLLLRKSNDQNDWALGDEGVALLSLAEDLRTKFNKDKDYTPSDDEAEFDRDDRELLQRLADDIGLAKKSMFIRTRISQRVRPDGPLAWIRRSTLTYACMRELYAVPDDKDLNDLAKKAVAQNLTVREVRTEMEAYRDKKGVDSGLYICKTCDEPIKHVENLVSVSKSGQRATFCGWNCAGVYVERKAVESGIPIPTEEGVPVDAGTETDEGVTLELAL